MRNEYKSKELFTMAEKQDMGETLVRIETRLIQIEKDVTEIKNDQKQNYATKTELVYLQERVKKLEDSIGKVVWLVLSLVITAVLYLVITVR